MDLREWLEADGLGGYATGTVSGLRTRRYHALSTVAATPPTGRRTLLQGLEVRAITKAGEYALSSHAYRPDVVHPDGHRRIVAFGLDPWPCWRFRCEDGTEIEQEIFVPAGAALVVVRFRLVAGAAARLAVRPLLSFRDAHALHHENPAFRFDPVPGPRLCWAPYPGEPALALVASGEYVHAPAWYRQFEYAEERARGLDCVEDLASPGELSLELRAGAALIAGDARDPTLASLGEPRAAAAALAGAERARRAALPSPLHAAGEAYLVARGRGKTVIAGYPWFTDWGRDTFIALRGLCLAAGRIDEARAILLEWSGAVSEGMLPNRFADGGAPEFNSVDASLWYCVAAHELFGAANLGAADQRRIAGALLAIVDGYARGTRHGIRADADGLLSCGEPGVQLTWMDARVDGEVITPRIGKPVEVQALWINALSAAAALEPGRAPAAARARAAFEARFWNEERGCLFDVVDDGHRPGATDASLRPNQLFAIGGLPLQLIEGERARRIVDLCEERLWTPLGPRSLAPGEPGYRGRCQGDPAARDRAYHQGTVWPWLAGPFVEAWARVRGGRPAAFRAAGARFLGALLRHRGEAGLGHVSEIADGDAPHAPRGCPFQAWSVGELLRLAAKGAFDPAADAPVEADPA